MPRKPKSEDAPKTTRAEQVRLLLAEEIVAGKLAPGVRLDEVEMARRYGVSRTPVREAIRQLAMVGLVENRPHRGVVVTPMSRDLISDLFEAYGEVLAACVRLAASRSDEAAEAGPSAPLGEDSETAIPDLLHAAAPNTVLRDTAHRLWSRLRPYRPSTAPLRAVAQAVERGDGEQAARLAIAAVREARDGLLARTESG